MNCELAQTTAHGYFDGELDAVRSAEFAKHLEECAACRASLASITSLHDRLQRADLYQPASVKLRTSTRKEVALDLGGARVPLTWWQKPLALASFGMSAAIAGFLIALLLIQLRSDTTRVSTEIVDAHVRSLQPGHLTDVQSSDQHTVKPWFDGKLDFVPPVNDYTAEGFPLIGGRLDVIDGHNVAVLIYGRRKHVVSVVVWGHGERGKTLVSSGSRQGYNWLTWRSGDMQFWITSDAAPSDLYELKKLFSGSTRPLPQ